MGEKTKKWGQTVRIIQVIKCLGKIQVLHNCQKIGKKIVKKCQEIVKNLCEFFQKGALGESKTKKGSMGESELNKGVNATTHSRHQLLVSTHIGQMSRSVVWY